MFFVRTNTGDYLNTNTVARLRPIPVGTGGSAGARFLDEAKRDGAVPIPEAVLGDLESESAPVIPADPTVLAVFISVDGSGERPVTVHAEPVPVVGWRVGKDNTASPVFAFKPSGRGTMLLPAGNGQLVGPGGHLYRSLDNAKADLLQAAQQRYDSEHPDVVVVEQKVEPIKLSGGRRR